MVTLSWLSIIILAAAGVAIADGIMRLRGSRSSSVLSIVELIAAGLLLVSIFVALPAPFTNLLFAAILGVVLVLLLVVPGTRRRGGSALTAVALVLTAAVILILVGWLQVPGVG